MSISDYASREHRTCVMMYPLAAVPPEKAEPPSRQRRTRIVCTLGPSSASRDVIVRLIRAGLDVARLNFSHGTHETHAATLATLRAAAAEVGRPVGVLQDLCGPKIRVGEMPAVQVRIMPKPAAADRTLAIGGVGELGVPTFAPALANAVFKLTGQRQRTLPFFPNATMSD